MALIHRWQFNEGSGNTITDSVGSLDLQAVAGQNVVWGSGIIRGSEKNFATLPSDFVHAVDGAIKATWTDGALTTFTIAMLCRSIRHVNGAFVRAEGGTFRGRSWSNGIDLTTSNDIALTEDQMPYTWNILIIACDNASPYIDVYVENVEDANRIIRINRATSINNGTFRLLSYADASNVAGLEIADVAIYNTVLNEAERQAYKNLFGALPDDFSWRQEGNNFGGVSRHVEAGSYVTVENETIKLSGDGLTCQIAVRQQIPYNMAEIWIETKYFIPAGFTANHGFGTSVNLFSLQKESQNTVDRLLAVQGLHSLPSNQITLNNVSYRNSIGNTDVVLDGTVITENEWHIVKAYINYTTGNIKVWYDGALKANLTGLTLDVSPKFLYTGLSYGIHPEDPVNYLYIKDIYIGEIEYVSPTPPVPPIPPTSTEERNFEKSNNYELANNFIRSSNFEKEEI